MIRIGSADTFAVVGSYWISSMRSLRNTTLPGVTATLRPTSKASAPAGGRPASVRSTSSLQLEAPRTRLRPPSFVVLAMLTGLSHGMLLGETMSIAARVMKATSASRSRTSPGTSWVAAAHHASIPRKFWT